MATGVKLPTGGRKRLVAVRGGKSAPAAPDTFDAADVKLWRALWAEPVAESWRPVVDVALVERLIMLRRRIERERDSTPVSVLGATLALEQQLLLTPRARTGGRSQIGAQPPVVGEREPVRRMSSRERERLLQG